MTTGLGDLEQLVLMSVIRLKDGAYTVAVRDDLSQCAGRDVTRGAVYVTLDRLERKGLLSSSLGAPSAERGGKAKRVFVITGAGRETLRASLDGLERMARSVRRALA